MQDYSDAATPILRELTLAGFSIKTIGELRQGGRRYQSAIPILIRWLTQVDDVQVKRDIIRALSVKWATPSPVPALIQAYRLAAPDVALQWSIGNALAVVADDSTFDDIAALARSKQYGKAREMVVVALGNMRDPRVVDILIELLHDEVVTGHAVIALGQIRAQRARAHIAELTRHPTAWVRKEAKRALAKIDATTRVGSA